MASEKTADLTASSKVKQVLREKMLVTRQRMPGEFCRLPPHFEAFKSENGRTMAENSGLSAVLDPGMEPAKPSLSRS
jgi:hypothetical protein